MKTPCRSFTHHLTFAFLFLFTMTQVASADTVVTNTPQLIQALENESAGSTITLQPGTYRISQPLAVKSGITLNGSGTENTIITHTDDWQPSTQSLPDPEVRMNGLDSNAYLIRVEDNANDVTLSNIHLKGPNTHGAVFALKNKNLKLKRLKIENFQWSGVRTYALSDSLITECEFIDAGGKWKRGGILGTDGGISGGAIFAAWTTDTEISHNRIIRTNTEKARAHFGIKGRGGKNIHIHHNTIEVNFSIEFPFESADRFEIDHNILRGVVSIPKHAGGKIPESGVTYDIHHNYFTTSYAIEFVRNAVKIHHNLFDFDTEKDGGNLISGFGKAPANGPAEFHHNLVSNPGRGVIWINEPYNQLHIHNNHIICRTTSTPRKEGLFGLNSKSDFSTIRIANNIIECIGQSRPLLRRDESYQSTIENNRLMNVSDTDRYENPSTGVVCGPEEPLQFQCGVTGELGINDWTITPAN